MAINEFYLSLLNSVLTQQRTLVSGGIKPKAVCLSYPDLLVSNEALSKILGEKVLKELTPRADQADVKKYHKLPDQFGSVYSTESLFDFLNVDVDFIDIKKLRGPEKVVDLNETLPAEFHNSYEFVVDTGTMEHCFNIASAFRAMCEMVKVGGSIISMAPMTIVNHGFWNICPTAYFDGFKQNGFEINFLRGLVTQDGVAKAYDLLPQPTSRYVLPAESNLICIARRISDQKFKWPIQSKYAAMLSG